MKLFAYFLTLAMLTSFSAQANNVDLKNSSLKWLGTKVTGKHFGEIKLKDGNLKMKNGNLTGGELVVDMKSVDVTDLKGEWKEKFLNHMKSGDFFETEKHPTARLKIKEVMKNKLKADLTIKGKTNEVTVPFQKKGNKYVGKLEFDRTKFGMRYKSGNFFKDLGDKMIHDEVKVDFEIAAKK